MNRRRFLTASLGSLVLAHSPRVLAQDRRCLSEPTPSDIEGPYYRPGAPERDDLVPVSNTHRRLTLSGVVQTRSCRPLAGAALEIWQADGDGEYDVGGDGFRGVLRTDARGRYSLRTVHPGRYRAGGQERPAHIHVKLHADGIEPLTTQLYFPGDPANERDPWHRSALEVSLLAVPPTCSRSRRAEAARFDFIL